VTAVLARDSVDRRREASETLVAGSEAGTEVAKVLPSKTIVGLAAVVALADEGIAVSPIMVRRPVRTMAVVLFASDMIPDRGNVDMAFSSIVRFAFLKFTLGLLQYAHWYQQAVNNLRILRWLKPSFAAIPTEKS
jgi:hypothetical protein